MKIDTAMWSRELVSHDELFAKLGGKFKWHQWLCHWALDDHEGLKGTGLALQPFANEKNKPRYRRADIDKFGF